MNVMEGISKEGGGEGKSSRSIEAPLVLLSRVVRLLELDFVINVGRRRLSSAYPSSYWSVSPQVS